MRSVQTAVAALCSGLLCVLALNACESVVPPDAEFASEATLAQLRCETLLDPGTATTPLTIGAVLPMTGTDGKADARGRHRSRAMQLALEEVNQNGGVADRLFRLRVCDTGGGWVTSGEEAARKLATSLIDDEGVQAIISGGSGDTLAMQTVTRPRGALLMSVSATSMAISDLVDDGLVWRVAPSDLHQGVVLAWLAKQALADSGGKSVAVMAIGNPYGDGLSKVIGDHLPANAHSGYVLKGDGSNLESELKRADGDDPDVLVVAAPATMAAKVVAARAKHKNLAAAALLLSDSAHNPDFIAGAGDAANLADAKGTLPGAPEGPAFKTFRSRYISSFGDDPAQQSFTAHAYDAAWCLALAHAWALGKAGKGKADGKGLNAGLGQLSDATTKAVTLEPTAFSPMRKALMAGTAVNIEGASGPLDFDASTGEAPSPVGIWSVDAKGSFVADKWVEVVDEGGKQQVKELPAP